MMAGRVATSERVKLICRQILHEGEEQPHWAPRISRRLGRRTQPDVVSRSKWWRLTFSQRMRKVRSDFVDNGSEPFNGLSGCIGW